MLRRHLKSGGAPVTACAGFDFDAASAYLEDALGQSHRAGYESHLAGCVTCRRHLIELARLAQTAPHAGRQPAPVADQAPAWVRWRGVAAGWFDLSSWNMKWQMAGVAGATFAILIAALGVQSLWQAPMQNELAGGVATSATASMESNNPAPTPEPSPQVESFLADRSSVAERQAQSLVTVPTPIVGMRAGDVSIPSTPSTESPKLNQNPQNGPVLFDFNSSNLRQDATAGAPQSNVPVQGRAFQQITPTQIADNAGNASKQSLANLGGLGRAETLDSAGQSRSNELAPRITPPPEINPMNSEVVETEQRSKSQPEKSQSEKSRLAKVAEMAKALIPVPVLKPDLKSEAKTLVAGTKPASKPESVGKEKPKPADDESSKPLKHRIRDKVFIFRREQNMWIDQDYKEETMLFRRLTLKRGSKEYEDVLARDPQLKEFFDHGPILIVWKNKIYRVR